MRHLPADPRLPLEAFEEDRVALHLGVRHFDRDRLVGPQIACPKDGGHAADLTATTESIRKWSRRSPGWREVTWFGPAMPILKLPDDP